MITTELTRATARAICRAVNRFGRDANMEWPLIHTAERIGMRRYMISGHLEDGISAGQDFLRSFMRHPSQVRQLEQPRLAVVRS